MSYPRHIQWYHFQADLIWPDNSVFNSVFLSLFLDFPQVTVCPQSLTLILVVWLWGHWTQQSPAPGNI